MVAVSRTLAGVAGDGGGGRSLAGVAVRRAAGDLPRLAIGTEIDATRAEVRDWRFRLLPGGQPRGADRPGGSDLRTGGSPGRSDNYARRYPLRHLVARASRRAARIRRGLVRDRVVVAVAEETSDDTRARGQRGAAAAVLDDLPRWGGVRGAGDCCRFRLRAPCRCIAVGRWTPFPSRRAGSDRARPHRRRAARGPGSRFAALFAAGADRLGHYGVHR